MVSALPNVGAKPTVEADAGWPRKDDTNNGLERPDGGRRSGSALERPVRPHCDAAAVQLCAANAA